VATLSGAQQRRVVDADDVLFAGCRGCTVTFVPLEDGETTEEAFEDGATCL
jgi:hypothetical protein